jgi:hypothetical protein
MRSVVLLPVVVLLVIVYCDAIYEVGPITTCFLSRAFVVGFMAGIGGRRA